MSRILWILTTLVVVEADTGSPVTSAAQQESTVTKADLERCKEQRVDAKECHTWIADNEARSNARMEAEHLTPRKVTDSELQRCKEQRVDAKDCQTWIADNEARINARMVAEHLTPRKVTDSELQRCKENRVDERGCQLWTAENEAQINARMVAEHLTPRKVTDSELQRCKEQRVDKVGCQLWIAEQWARKQKDRADKLSDKKEGDAEKQSIDDALARLTKKLKRMQDEADEEARKSALRADQEARKAHDASSNGKDEAKIKPETSEPAILLSINRQSSTLLFSLLVAGMLVYALIAMIVRVKRAHVQQSMKSPLLEELFADV